MKSKNLTAPQWIIRIIFPIFAIFAILVMSGCTSARSDAPEKSSCNDLDVTNCTVFTVSQGEKVFFGGNSDWINFESNYYWVDPGDNTHYGAIFFGKPDNVQQGFNEVGLAYDANGLPEEPVNIHAGSEPVYGSYASYPIKILQECATVDEVISWVNTHQWHTVMWDQLHFADASGAAVVISAGPDGKVTFTRKPEGNSYLVSTNFNLANPNNGTYPCWRFDLAEQMLKEIVTPEELIAERVASILDAVHVESTTNWTIMSVVGDLPQGLVYVYLFHQFDSPIILNIADEIAKAPGPGPLRDLFPPETIHQADQAYQRILMLSTKCKVLGFSWLGLVILSIVGLLILARSKPNHLAFWVFIVTVLGPIGLLVWLIARRDIGSPVLIEVLGDLPPNVIGLVITFLCLVLVPGMNQSIILQLLAIYAIPLFLSLFFYQAPVLAWTKKESFIRTAFNRLPFILVTTNLALAGLIAVAGSLIKRNLDYCGLNSSTILSWWAFSALGAIVGGLLLLAFHAWGNRHGFSNWSVLLLRSRKEDSNKVISTRSLWRQLWVWILLSFIILFAGLISGMMISS
ncbi:MAG: hypothetical protein ABIJ65_09920 [Chloroflexota bacterium]